MYRHSDDLTDYDAIGYINTKVPASSQNVHTLKLTTYIYICIPSFTYTTTSFCTIDF